MIGLPSLLVALSAAAGVPFAAFAGDIPAMNLMGFELVNLTAGVIGVLIGLGRFRAGTGLGALCVAGAIAVGSLFGSISTQHAFAGVQILPIAFARAGLAGLILFAMAMHLLGTNKGAWFRLILGAVLGLPPLTVAAMAATGRGTNLFSSMSSLPPVVSLFIGSVVFIIGSVLLAVGVHLVVRAFELGRISAAEPDQTPAKPSAPAAE